MRTTIRGNDEHPLGELIRLLLAAYGLDDKLAEVRLKEAWYSLMGPVAKRYTASVSIRDRVMYIALRSAALRYELSMSKEKLLKNLHEEAGVEPYLRDLILR